MSDCSCADPAIVHVRVELHGLSPAEIVGTKPCTDRGACTFTCDRKTGVTPLDIPAGNYAIEIVPLDVAGKDMRSASVRVPPAIVRDVVFGQVTGLGALQIVVPCASGCSSGGSSTCAH